jgi:ATP-dependent protease HslVU (ClpYQ) peptidase subunit
MHQHGAAKQSIEKNCSTLQHTLMQADIEDMLNVFAAFAVMAPKREPTEMILRHLKTNNVVDPDMVLVNIGSNDEYARVAVAMIEIMHKVVKAKKFKNQPLSRDPLIYLLSVMCNDVNKGIE